LLQQYKPPLSSRFLHLPDTEFPLFSLPFAPELPVFPVSGDTSPFFHLSEGAYHPPWRGPPGSPPSELPFQVSLSVHFPPADTGGSVDSLSGRSSASYNFPVRIPSVFWYLTIYSFYYW